MLHNAVIFANFADNSFRQQAGVATLVSACFSTKSDIILFV